MSQENPLNQACSLLRTLVAPDGGLYLSDEFNHRLIKLDAAGKRCFEIGGKGPGPGKFHYPSGLAWWRGGLAVADRWNHRVQFFDLDGKFLAQVGSYGAGSGQFDNPVDLAVGEKGLLWVADFGNNRLCALDEELRWVEVLASSTQSSGADHYRIPAAFVRSGEAVPRPPMLFPRQLLVEGTTFTIRDQEKILQIRAKGWCALPGNFAAAQLVACDERLVLVFHPLEQKLELCDLLNQSRLELGRFAEGLLALVLKPGELLLVGEAVVESLPIPPDFLRALARGEAFPQARADGPFASFRAEPPRALEGEVGAGFPGPALIRDAEARRALVVDELFEAFAKPLPAGTCYATLPKRRLFELYKPIAALHTNLIAPEMRAYLAKIKGKIQKWLAQIALDLQLLSALEADPERACDFAQRLDDLIAAVAIRIELARTEPLVQIRQFVESFEGTGDPDPYYRADLALFFVEQFWAVLDLFALSLEAIRPLAMARPAYTTMPAFRAKIRYQMHERQLFPPSYLRHFPSATSASEALDHCAADVLRLIEADLQKGCSQGEARDKVHMLRQAFAYLTECDQLFYVDGDEPVLFSSFAVLALLLTDYARFGRLEELRRFEQAMRPHFSHNTGIWIDYARYAAAQAEPEALLPALDEAIRSSAQIVAGLQAQKHTCPSYYHFNDAVVIKNNLLIALGRPEEAGKTLEQISYSLHMYPHFKARNLLYQYRFEEALEAFRSATLLKQQSTVWPWENDYGMGMALLFMRRWDEAIQTFTKPLHRIPLAVAAIGRFSALRLSRRFAEAETFFASIKHADCPKMQMHRGILLRNMGRTEEALEAFFWQTRKYPTWANALQELLTLHVLGDPVRIEQAWANLSEIAWILWEGRRIVKRHPLFTTAIRKYLEVEQLDPDSLDPEQLAVFYWQLDHLLERNSLNY